MPIYAYRCERCGHAKDVLQKVSDPVLTVCPACGESTFRKQVTAAGFQLKGSGWYVTDFRGDKPSGKSAEAGADGDAKPADSKKPMEGRRAKGSDAKGGDSAVMRQQIHGSTVAPGPKSKRAHSVPSEAARRTTVQVARTAAAAALARRPEIRVKRYLIAGLLVWLPLAVTIWVLQAVLGLLDGVFLWLLSGSQIVLPVDAHASIQFLRTVPGLGVIVMLLGLLLTGVFATNIFGQWWLRQGHRLLNKIPIVSDLQSGSKCRNAVREQRQRLRRPSCRYRGRL